MWIGQACHGGAMASSQKSQPRAFDGLCDDEGVPVICPTCQVLAQSVLAGDRLLLCMGLFSIFLVGSQSDAAWLRESCLKPHTPARPPL
jgi:hypothetical protein